MALWVGAVALLAIGIFGPEPDPLAGVFLVPIGLPWVLWIDLLPQSIHVLAAVLAPGLNIAILLAACRAIHGRPMS